MFIFLTELQMEDSKLWFEQHMLINTGNKCCPMGTFLLEPACPQSRTAVPVFPELFCNLFTSNKCCSHGWIYEDNDLTDQASL